jgi:hypothetical protein
VVLVEYGLLEEDEADRLIEFLRQKNAVNSEKSSDSQSASSDVDGFDF